MHKNELLAASASATAQLRLTKRALMSQAELYGTDGRRAPTGRVRKLRGAARQRAQAEMDRLRRRPTRVPRALYGKVGFPCVVCKDTTYAVRVVSAWDVPVCAKHGELSTVVDLRGRVHFLLTPLARVLAEVGA